MKKIAYFVQFPIHYQVPLLRKLSKEVDLTVFYISDITTREFEDKGFGKINWSTPLLEGYKYKFLTNLISSKSYGFLKPVATGVIASLTREKWDAVWLHGYAHHSLVLGFLIARMKGIPVYLRMESNLISTKQSFLKDLLVRYMVRSAKALLWISSDNRDYYLHYGARDDQMFFCPYAVDNDYFQKKAEEFRGLVFQEKEAIGLIKDNFIVLYASKLVKRKNPMHLLSAFEKVVNGGHENTSLIFVGAGEEELKLKQYVSERALAEKVKFVGFKNQDVLPLYYQMADVFVLPSSREPFGMVIPEVLNFAKPVIVTDEVGSAKDLVIDGVNGYIVKPGDIKVISEKLTNLIENPHLAADMGQESLKKIKRWSYKENIEAIKNALAQ